MRLLLAVLFAGMVVFSACGETVTTQEVDEQPTMENQTVVSQPAALPDDYTDIQTAQDDFDALDDVLGELE